MPETDESLRKAIVEGRAIVIAGAGVSATTTRNQPQAGWIGLLRSGVEFVTARSDDQQTAAKWGEVVESVLSAGIESDDSSLIVNAAGLVCDRMNDLGTQAKASWLQETIGELTVEDPSWIDAIGSLPCPILTTNYDTLIEGRLDRTSSTRANLTDFQSSVSGASQSVVHLHGIWTDCESVVLSDADYARLLSDGSQQALQQAVSSTKSVLYIGCGSGIDDPNFSRLLKWHHEHFPQSGVKHYRLCRNEDLDKLQRQHRNDNIKPISFGENYADLPAFLATLRSDSDLIRINKAGLARDIAAEAQASMLTALSNEIREVAQWNSLDATAVSSVKDITLPPVLLPVPYQEFLDNATASDQTTRDEIKRLDPDLECRRDGVTIVVGDEQSGLTTTLKWLVMRAGEISNSQTPVIVSFADRQPGKGPLHRLVRQEAIEKDIIERKNDPMPSYALAVDDFSPYVPKISDNVITDLVHTSANSVFLGCRTGDESAIIEKLRAVHISARLLYVGKVNTADVVKLAKRAAPVTHGLMVKKIVSVLSAERLPRTPFTISLLISILLRGEDVAGDASATGILDQYLSLLMGRGDPRIDSRHSIGADQSATALAALAHEFVRRERVYLPESDVLSILEVLKQKFAWPESATDMLLSFKDRRIIVNRGSGVAFARSSYLHLFAAKSAVRDKEFLTHLMSNVLKFSSVVKHYAALNRRNDSLMGSLTALLLDFSRDVAGPSIYEDVSRPDAPPSLTGPEMSSDPVTEEKDHVPLDSTSNEPRDPLDSLPDHDREPFIEMVESEESFLSRHMLALETVSTVLRESDEVSDLAAKQKLLETVLSGWGAFVAQLSEDPAFKEVRATIVRQMHDDDADDDQEVLIERIFSLIAPMYVAGSIHNYLSSRKLLTTLESIMDSDGYMHKVPNAAAVAMLLVSTAEPGWVGQVAKLMPVSQNSKFFREFFTVLIIGAYFTDRVSPAERSSLLTLAATSVADKYKFKNSNERSAAVKTMKRRLENDKARVPSQIELFGSS